MQFFVQSLIGRSGCAPCACLFVNFIDREFFQTQGRVFKQITAFALTDIKGRHCIEVFPCLIHTSISSSSSSSPPLEDLSVVVLSYNEAFPTRTHLSVSFSDNAFIHCTLHIASPTVTIGWNQAQDHRCMGDSSNGPCPYPFSGTNPSKAYQI